MQPRLLLPHLLRQLLLELDIACLVSSRGGVGGLGLKGVYTWRKRM